MSAPATMRRRLSQPPRRGESQVTAARNSPIDRNSSKYVNGASQTKCRVIWYRWLAGLMLLDRAFMPTSSNPPARPHQADNKRTSRARTVAGPREVGPIAARRSSDPGESCRSSACVPPDDADLTGRYG